TSLGETVYQDLGTQMGRVKDYVWQEYAQKRWPIMTDKGHFNRLSQVVVTRPAEDHIATCHMVFKGWEAKTLSSDWVRLVEPVAVENDFRILRDYLQRLLSDRKSVFSRDTRESSTLLSWVMAQRVVGRQKHSTRSPATTWTDS